MSSLTVIVPTREQENQVGFLNRAIASVEAQDVRGRLDIEVWIGTDPGASQPPIDHFDIPVHFTSATERSAASALNAAAAKGSGDYIAVLEDDDSWHPNHLDLSLQALENSAFVSGTQLEVDPKDTVVRINDFATPDSWVMPRSTWEQVGPFDTNYRYHTDNEWLGRLAEHGLQRTHLVESTAPLSIDVAFQVRPWLARLIDLSGGHVHLMRHRFPVPLVRRLVHPDSGMQRISAEAETRALSENEYDRLMQRYGRIPW